MRAAVHVHSEWSYDGGWKLQDIHRAFDRRGYDVVLMAEHDIGFTARRWEAYRRACAAVSSEKLLLLPGLEYGDRDNRLHVSTWGALPFLGEGRPTKDILEAANTACAPVVFAHPSRREAWRLFDPAWVSLLSGFELWNRKYDGWAPNRHAAERVRGLDDVTPYVALDFHTRRQFFPLAMVLSIEGELNEASITHCLRARACRPEAFGIPADRLANGVGFWAANSAEAARRPLARSVRRVMQLRGAGSRPSPT